MEKLVPIGKKSKKEQKAYHLKQRRTWGDMKPITKVMPNGKAYVRRRVKSEKHLDD